MTAKDQYVLVPVEPTREMWEASGNAVNSIGHRFGLKGHHDRYSAAVWSAMLGVATAGPEGLGVPQEDPDPSPKPSGDGLVDREVIARVIDCEAFGPRMFTPDADAQHKRSIALTKADSIITLLGWRSGNTSSVAGSSRGFMAPTDDLHSAGKED